METALTNIRPLEIEKPTTGKIVGCFSDFASKRNKTKLPSLGRHYLTDLIRQGVSFSMQNSAGDSHANAAL